MKQTSTITSRTISASSNSPTIDTDIPITPSVPSAEGELVDVLVDEGDLVSILGLVSMVVVKRYLISVLGLGVIVSMVTGLDSVVIVGGLVWGLGTWLVLVVSV